MGAWLTFFVDAVTATAGQAVETAQRLLRQAAEDRERIGHLGRTAGSILMVHRVLQKRPIASAAWIAAQTGFAPATVNMCLRQLEALHVVTEVTGKKRNRLYGYQQYLRILNEGTELSSMQM